MFTFVPLLLLLQIRRRAFSWTWRAIVAVVAVVLAAPNFRAGSLTGAVVGALLALAVTAASMRMKHRKMQVEKLTDERDQLKDRQAPEDR